MARVRFVAPCAMVITWVLAGCGSYADTSKGGAAGAPAGGSPAGGSPAGGSPAAGAPAAGSPAGGTNTAGAPVGGSSPSGGQGGGAGGSSGGGAGMASCMDVPACGGDVVGTWTSAGCEIAVGGQANLKAAGIGCSKADITGSLKVTGSWTATADGKYQDKTTTTGSVSMVLEKQCLEISGFFGTCDRLVFDPIGLTAIKCVDNPATEGCTCTGPIEQHGALGAISLAASFNSPDGASGQYKAADNKVTTTFEGADTEYGYCVAGTTLTMNLTSESLIGTLTGPIVLQKQ